MHIWVLAGVFLDSSQHRPGWWRQHLLGLVLSCQVLGGRVSFMYLGLNE